MKERKRRAVGFTILGLILLAAGFILLKTLQEPQGILVTLPYILVGFGCGIFGHNLGGIISFKATEKYPDLTKSIEIEQKDERNVFIQNKAKAKAYEIMIFVYSAVLLSFAIMKVDMKLLIVLVIVYLFVVFTEVYYKSKYDKEM